MPLPSLVLVASVLAQSSADPASFMRDTFQVTEFETAKADLDGDGDSEFLIWATARDRCDEAGCTLFVLSPNGHGFDVKMKAAFTNPPIRILSTSTHGWRDLAVAVSGGGITRPFEAQMRFDGAQYPGDPRLAPAVALDPASADAPP